MSALTKIWRKLRTASWDELSVRGRQEFERRADALHYRLGKPFPTDISAAPSAKQSLFFFPNGEARSVVDLISETLPDQPKEWVARAERICAHQFDLLGYKGLDYGDRVRWHWDAVHNKEAPRLPWFQVDYLNFDVVGDAKVTWELNRHQHLVVLAKAYVASGNAHFRDELIAQWYVWRHENTYPIGINWASSLEVALRSISWIWVLRLLEGSADIKGFERDVLGMLRLQGRHIQRFLSTYFSPNTHLLGEALAMFFIGTFCPEIPEASVWQRDGWQILLREAQRQVRADGTYFEQSTYYHVYALDMFLHACLLAAHNDIEIPSELEECISRMLTVLASLSQCGAPPRLGDDDGGRLFDPSRNEAGHLLDPLSVGAVLCDRADLAQVAGDLCEENIWLLGRAGLEKLVSLRASPEGASALEGASPLAAIAKSGRKAASASIPRAFPHGGIYVMCSSDGHSQLTLDAGPLGSLAGGHGHADLLALHLSVDGKEVLADAGTGEYVGVNRAKLRATAAHNTLEVDSVSQAEPDGPFAWESLPTVNATWREGPSFQFLRAEHYGYERLASPVRHRRSAFHTSNFFFIADEVLGSGIHNFALHWNLGLEPVAEQDSPRRLRIRSGENELSICWHAEGDWQSEIVPAVLSPVYGRVLPSNRWRISTRAAVPTEIATLISVTEESAANLARLKGSNEGVTAYLCASGADYRFFCLGKRTAWTFQDWSSDAAFIFIEIALGRPPAFVAFDVSHFTVNGTPLLKYANRVEQYDYRYRDDKSNFELGLWLEDLSKELLQSTNETKQ